MSALQTSSRTHAAAAQLVSTIEAFGLPLPRLTSVRPDCFDMLLASPDEVREWGEFLTGRNSSTAAVSEVIGVTKVKATWLGVEFEAFYAPSEVTSCERCYEDRPELVPCADDSSEHCEQCVESCIACAAAFWDEQDAEANRRDRTGDL